MTRNDALTKLKNIMSDTFELSDDQITESLNFRNDLGADSISMMEFVLELESEFDVEISDDEMEQITTVAQALDYIVNHTN